MGAGAVGAEAVGVGVVAEEGVEEDAEGVAEEAAEGAAEGTVEEVRMRLRVYSRLLRVLRRVRCLRRLRPSSQWLRRRLRLQKLRQLQLRACLPSSSFSSLFLVPQSCHFCVSFSDRYVARHCIIC